ncbi:unnamed protein product, partial [Rotaria magnacalcarata]
VQESEELLVVTINQLMDIISNNQLNMICKDVFNAGMQWNLCDLTQRKEYLPKIHF